ncbi:oxidoreductase [Xylariaceae sp. FL0016]|nr:oxidoreductase [Xylariaceae sp. FL0016]
MSGETLFPGVAVVTGAGGTGIGSATAHAFAAAGCTRIAITDIQSARLSAVRDAITASYPEVQILAIPSDVSLDTSVANLFKEVLNAFGRVDYAVNCAGIAGTKARTGEMSLAEFEEVMGVNMRGVWLSAKEELTIMRGQEMLSAGGGQARAERGSIVNIASQLGIVGKPNHCASTFATHVAKTSICRKTWILTREAAAYSASKAAVIALTRGDAIDYAKDGIRVNAICPGVIDTPMTACANDAEREELEPWVQMAPMGRIGSVQEIADVALFLCSRKASFVTGHAMVVDGGYILG